MNDDLIDACLAISDGTLVPEEFLGRLHSRMQMVLQNLAEEEGASPSSSPVAREGGAADETGGSTGNWDDGNRKRWQDILGRLSAQGVDPVSLRGASLRR